jgi:pimeloyl-ACP methyl ester carboxylesterase
MAETATTASASRQAGAQAPLTDADTARRALMATMPLVERRLELAGISTAVFEGGAGDPIVLLHGPMANAAHWMGVVTGLVATHRVIVPDLPGHGASEAGAAPLDPGRVLAWLAALIDRTCEPPATVVGHLIGGAIAAHFAGRRPAQLGRLVLVDTFGLQALALPPDFGLAMQEYLQQPDGLTHDRLWGHCAFDLGALRNRMASLWQPFVTYNLALARTPRVHVALHQLMEHFALPAIAPATLESIEVPTALVWGRHDRATPLATAEAASLRYGWPLHVIDHANDDPPVEQPDAVLGTLHAVLGSARTHGAAA